MTKYFDHKHLFALIVLILLTFSVGCGGGGGGGGVVTPPLNEETDNAPLASNLTSSQSEFSHSSSAANLVVTLPVIANQVANFLMTVTNNSSSDQTVALTPATSFAASVKPDESLLQPSMRVVPDQDLVQMYSVKGQLEENLRRNTLNALRQTGGNLRASLRASNHTDEYEGSIYPISMVSSASGFSYVVRNCKLARKTAHCKIFVDQDAYDGLSAANGDYMVTSDDVTHFAEEFETFIYTLMHNNYGDVYDIDGDGCLSIIISPVYAKIGFAGLFNSIDMTPGATTNSNQRDLIGIWSPSSTKWSGEYWRAATRETIAHEMQHAINYSAKVYPGGFARTGVSNYDTLLETMWIDEGLSVAAEARYRDMRGKAGKTSSFGGQIAIDSVANDSRFNYWVQRPWSVRMDDFSYSFNAFEHYGQKGLFNFYLYERFEADKIRSLVQTTATGLTNFENVFGAGSFATLVKDWQFAVANEGLRTAGQIDITTIDRKYRYQSAMKLSTAYQAVQYDAMFPGSVSVAPGATAFYVVRQPSGTSGSEYKFIIESNQDQSIVVNMMRLP